QANLRRLRAELSSLRAIARSLRSAKVRAATGDAALEWFDWLRSLTVPDRRTGKNRPVYSSARILPRLAAQFKIPQSAMQQRLKRARLRQRARKKGRMQPLPTPLVFWEP